ncbi:MAG: hypothetical protein HY902_05730 [Deltaproteobacteria bacterium]|nr:hypothetical protein [Deltaproteobacteria bacterium]
MIAPTLSWPFGRDQAIFHYIGRQWGAGLLPYRDAFDVKPPGIFGLYRLTSALAGDAMWTVRAADALAWLAIGALLPWAWPGRADRRPTGPLMAAGALIAVAGYFAVFDFWDTAQTETWQVLGCVAGAAAARWLPGLWAAAVAGGLLGGAMLFKPTALVMAPWLLGNFVASPRQAKGVSRAVVGSAVAAVAAAAVFGGVFAWLYYRGAGPALGELWDYQRAYAKVPLGHGEALPRLALVWDRQFHLWPVLLGASLLLDLALLWYASTAGPALLSLAAAIGLLALSFAAVAVQGKYFTYHFVAMLPVVAGAATSALGRLADRAGGAKLLAGLSLVLSLGAWATAAHWPYDDRVSAPRLAVGAWPKWMAHRIDAPTWFGHFREIANYDFANHYRIAKAINALKKPGDGLHVRGFELPIYALTGLSTPARFVSELPLEDGTLATEHRERWQADHDQRLWTDHPPRFVVTFVDRQWDLDALQQRGYQKNVASGLLQLMVHEPAPK